MEGFNVLDQPDIPDHSKAKRTLAIVFTVFMFVTSFSFVSALLATDQSAALTGTAIRFFGIILLFYFLYKGKEWAGGLLSFIILWAAIVIVFKLIRSASFLYILGIVYYFIILFIHFFTLYYLNYNKKFQAFYRYQKKLSDRKNR